MAILVTILKWIGIILLCLLGLLLFLVLMTLFYPVTYRVHGILGEKLPEDITVKLRVRWFFALAGFALVFQKGELSWKLSFCGIPLRRFPGKEKKPKKRKATAGSRNSGSIEAHDEAPETGTVPITAADAGHQEETEQHGAASLPQKGPEASASGREGILTRIRRRELRLRAKVRALIDKIRSIPAFFRRLWEKLTNIMEIIGDGDNRQAAWFVIREVLELLKKYGPRRIRADLSYSAGEPAATGQVLAGLSVLPFLYQHQVSIRPDFESEVFYVRGAFDMKGHIQAVHLLGAALHIYKNKQVKKLIHQVRS